MPFYVHSDVLDNGLNYIINNCNKVIITDSFTTTYSIVTSTAKISESNLYPTDFILSGGDGENRTITILLEGKSGGRAIKSLVDGSSMHIVLASSTQGKVLYVTEELTNINITLGNIIQFTSNISYTLSQP